MGEIKICELCGKLLFENEDHKNCKPKTMLEYRTETYDKDQKLGVW